MTTGETEMPPAAAAPPFTLQDMVEAMTLAFREASMPTPPPPPEIVAVGVNSDPKIDKLVICEDCRGRDGGAWGAHTIYWPAADPERPGQIKRMSVLHAHPHVPKAMSYDKRAVTEGLKLGTHGKQCIQCGAPLRVA